MCLLILWNGQYLCMHFLLAVLEKYSKFTDSFYVFIAKSMGLQILDSYHFWGWGNDYVQLFCF